MKITQSRPDSSLVSVNDKRDPKSKLKQRQVIVLVEHFEKMDGVFVPVSGQHKRVDEGIEVRLITIRQSSIVVNPDLEEIGAFSHASFPDGTLLRDHYNPGLVYEMLGGILTNSTLSDPQ